MLLTRLLDVLFLSLLRKAASWITFIGPQTVNTFARAHASIQSVSGARRGAPGTRSRNRSGRQQVGRWAERRTAPSTGDKTADLNLRPLLLWTNLTGSFIQQHGRTEKVRKPVHHVGEQGGGEEETGRHHQPLERQPARPVRDQPAHRGRRPPRSSRRGRGPAGPLLGEWETVELPPADTSLRNVESQAVVGSVVYSVYSVVSPRTYSERMNAKLHWKILRFYVVLIHTTQCL